MRSNVPRTVRSNCRGLDLPRLVWAPRSVPIPCPTQTMFSPMRLARVCGGMRACGRSISTASAPCSGAQVVVVGSNIMDLTAYTPRLPAVGETVLGHHFQSGFGGKVCACVCACAHDTVATSCTRGRRAYSCGGHLVEFQAGRRHLLLYRDALVRLSCARCFR